MTRAVAPGSGGRGDSGGRGGRGGCGRAEGDAGLGVSWGARLSAIRGSRAVCSTSSTSARRAQEGVNGGKPGLVRTAEEAVWRYPGGRV